MVLHLNNAHPVYDLDETTLLKMNKKLDNETTIKAVLLFIHGKYSNYSISNPMIDFKGISNILGISSKKVKDIATQYSLTDGTVVQY